MLEKEEVYSLVVPPSMGTVELLGQPGKMLRVTCDGQGSHPILVVKNLKINLLSRGSGSTKPGTSVNVSFLRSRALLRTRFQFSSTNLTACYTGYLE